MPLVVSDTSPIRALFHLQRLDLLSRLFDVVLIPPAVSDELSHPSKRFPPIEVARISGAVMRSPAREDDVRDLLRELQAGEAQAIALAEEVNAQLLIDEMAGRLIALRRGLRVTGVVGVLVEARCRGLIPAAVPMLERLRSELGFYLADDLIQYARRECEE